MVANRIRTLTRILRARAIRRRRAEAVREMAALSALLPQVSAAQFAQWIREERGWGH